LVDIARPSITAGKITPHTLRHTAAMNLLHAGVDITVIALWLGHESPATTRIYLHADMALKENAIARTSPPGTQATGPAGDAATRPAHAGTTTAPGSPKTPRSPWSVSEWLLPY
jgi:integrase-like protein